MSLEEKPSCACTNILTFPLARITEKAQIDPKLLVCTTVDVCDKQVLCELLTMHHVGYTLVQTLHAQKITHVYKRIS